MIDYLSFLVFSFIFVFGTIIGSFLNVVLFRFDSQIGISGRSRCPSCCAQLSWFELIPILSYIALGGRCRTCKTAISIQYPLVELSAGLLFLGAYLSSVSIAHMLYLWLVLSLLVLIAVYDLRHMLMPSVFLYPFIAAAFLGQFFDFFSYTVRMPAFSDLLAAVLAFLFFFLLWIFSRGRWIGFGDALLALGIGFALGFPGTLSALILSFWIGAAVGIALVSAPHIARYLHSGKTALSQEEKRLTMKSAVPFAPFLILGFLLVFFFGLDVAAFIGGVS